MNSWLSSSVDDPARKALSRADRILFVASDARSRRLERLKTFFEQFGYSVSSLLPGGEGASRRGCRDADANPQAQPADLVVVLPEAKELWQMECWIFFARGRQARALWFEPVPEANDSLEPRGQVIEYGDGQLLVFTGRQLHRAYVDLFLTCSCT